MNPHISEANTCDKYADVFWDNKLMIISEF